MRATIWTFTILGVVMFTVDAVDFTWTGLALFGLVLLTLAAWLGGVFTRAFWVADDPDQDALGSLDLLERNGRGHA